MTGAADRALRRSRTGGRARLAGRGAEVLAALWFLARGYRILGFRLKVHGVEIDLAVARGQVIAVVEVKRRATLDAALGAVGARQRQRLRRAGEALAGLRTRAAGPPLSVRLDLFALAPGRLPRHIPDAWRGEGRAAEVGPWP
jgi:putative endonuclease